VDFNDGSNTLWIENNGQTAGLLQEFKAWFEDEQYKKVWHNYGFDRHVMFNEGMMTMMMMMLVLTKRMRKMRIIVIMVMEMIMKSM
jgi:DNA polymerase I-like protein with 3'-5' exonuclease and polymerase domains